MKARAFRYFRAESLQGALEAYDRAGGDCCYLAGGQSLVPSLSLRLQAPELIIDISRIEALTGISRSGNVLRVGALTRHAELLTSLDIAHDAPLLRLAAPFVAHPAIRNMGTLGGTIALADPAAEFPAVMLALDAEFEIAGRDGVRTTRADGFFRGLFESGLGPGEILTAVHIPCFAWTERCAFDELARRRGDYALAGAAVQARFAENLVSEVRIAFFSVGPTPLRTPHAEAAITGRILTAEVIFDAQAALDDDLDPEDDQETSSAMRMHLARILLGRLLGRLSRSDRVAENEVP